MAKVLAPPRQWLSLSEAARRLNVHPNTLRRWADQGNIPVLLTPGGHRRFSAASLDHFAQERHRLRQAGPVEQIWARQALADTRKEVVVHQGESWLTRLDDESRQRHRLLGQRLMGLTLQYVSNENGGEFLDEARQVGRQYGQIALETGLPLPQALEAAIFFRDTLVETALHLPDSVRLRPEANVQLLRRINGLLNAVLLAITEVYDATFAPHPRRR
ncbi:MAG: helix-turn-helix domain-containing protein [Candidatus Promineifilaceae bacterium]